AGGLSANTVSRLKAGWIQEHAVWRKRDLSDRRYVYWWADGVYSGVRMDDRLCLLVIIGVTEHGRKELVAGEDGFRESAADWEMVLTGLRARGLPVAPKLAVADGALGFWAAMGKVFPKQHTSAAGSTRRPTSSTSCPSACSPGSKRACRISGWPNHALRRTRPLI